MQNSIQDSWTRIVDWLADNNVNLKSLQPAKSDTEIKKTETLIGRSLPNDFVEFYRLTNGVKPGIHGVVGMFPPVDDGAMFPQTLSAIRYDWKMLRDLLNGGDFDNAKHNPTPQEVKDVFWCLGWIPFAGNEGGDYYCIDLEPTDSGTVGQIISHCHEGGQRYLIAGSLKEYLSEIASGIESGKFVYDQMEGLVPCESH